MPALNSLMAGLASATRSIASFIAGVFGTPTYSKASAAAKKLQTVSSGAKKAAGQLASFDKLMCCRRTKTVAKPHPVRILTREKETSRRKSLGERFKTLLDGG